MVSSLFSFTIDNRDEGSISATIEINKNHDIFKGHFPGVPILPGVCQVLMVKEIVNSFFNTKLELRKAKNIKFLSMLDPNETKNLKVKILYKKDNENVIKIDATLYKEELNYLKLKGEFYEIK